MRISLTPVRKWYFIKCSAKDAIILLIRVRCSAILWFCVKLARVSSFLLLPLVNLRQSIVRSLAALRSPPPAGARGAGGKHRLRCANNAHEKHQHGAAHGPLLLRPDADAGFWPPLREKYSESAPFIEFDFRAR